MKPASELTDAELNRALIWLYCEAFNHIFEVGNLEYRYIGQTFSGSIDYLNDWNQLMPLFYKHNLNIVGDSMDVEGYLGHQPAKNTRHTISRKVNIRKWTGEPHQRAICECLYEIKRLEKDNG